MSSNRFRVGLLGIVAVVGLMEGCGGSSTGPSVVTSPTPTPTPAAITTVVGQGTFTGLAPKVLGYVPFSTSASGTIEVTIDWTFASNDVDLFLVRGTNPCTVQQFNDRTCAFLGTAESATTKPEHVRVASLAAGVYTFYAVNFGTTTESVAYQVTLTSVPGASAAVSGRPGGAKVPLVAANALAMQ